METEREVEDKVKDIERGADNDVRASQLAPTRHI